MNPSAARGMRLHLIEALAKRASGLEGDARRIVEEKRAALIALEQSASAQEVVTGSPGRGRLGQMVDHMAAGAGASAYPEIPALEAFRKRWSTLRSESQLRQTLEHVPENAGPLNSSSLVHRSIELMRELSPGYLRQFLSYVDDLSWLDRLSAGAIVADKNAPQAATIGKRPRARSRGRRPGG